MKKLSFCFALLLAAVGAFAQSFTYLPCGCLLDFTGESACLKSIGAVTVEEQQITDEEITWLETIDFTPPDAIAYKEQAE